MAGLIFWDFALSLSYLAQTKRFDMEINQNNGKIEGLQLTNFTCFSDLELSFSEGINLFIGENGLGKTHLLKMLFITASSEGDKFFSSTPALSPLMGSTKT